MYEYLLRHLRIEMSRQEIRQPLDAERIQFVQLQIAARFLRDRDLSRAQANQRCRLSINAYQTTNFL